MAVPPTLADDELLHAVLEPGHAAEPLGRALQGIVLLTELGTQRRDLALQSLLLGQDEGREWRAPSPIRAPSTVLTLPWCWAGLTGSTVLQKVVRREAHSSSTRCRVLALPQSCPAPAYPGTCGKRVQEWLLLGHPHPAAPSELPSPAQHSREQPPGLDPLQYASSTFVPATGTPCCKDPALNAPQCHLAWLPAAQFIRGADRASLLAPAPSCPRFTSFPGRITQVSSRASAFPSRMRCSRER